MANQQANMVAALGTSDSSYLRMTSVNGVGNFHPLTGPGQFHNNAFRSFPPSGMVGRLNTPAGLGLHCLPSSGMFQLSHAQNPSNSINDQPLIFPGNRNGNILPAPLELDQQHGTEAACVADFSAAINGTTVYPTSSGLPDAKVFNSSNDAPGLADNPILRHTRDSEVGRNYVNQSSVSRASLRSELSPPFLDHGRLNDNWSGASQPSMFCSNSFSSRDSFNQPTLLQSNLKDNMPVMSSQIGSSQIDVSISCQSQDSRFGLPIQASAISNNSGQTINNDPFQGWDDHKPDSQYPSDVMCTSMNSLMPVNDTGAPFDQNSDSRRTTFQRNMGFNSIGQSNFLDPLLMKYDDVELTQDASVKMRPGYLMDQRKLQGGYNPNNVGSLDELVSAMMKQVRNLFYLPCLLLFELGFTDIPSTMF